MEKKATSKRYPPELKERAVRMVKDLRQQDPGGGRQHDADSGRRCRVPVRPYRRRIATPALLRLANAFECWGARGATNSIQALALGATDVASATMRPARFAS
jgi:hypothetical protein